MANQRDGFVGRTVTVIRCLSGLAAANDEEYINDEYQYENDQAYDEYENGEQVKAFVSRLKFHSITPNFALIKEKGTLRVSKLWSCVCEI